MDTDDTQVVTITAGRLSAGINRHGARLEYFRRDGVDLVVAPAGPGPEPGYHGAVIGPWPNRVADGTWIFDGIPHHAPINEPARGAALHGFTPWLDWDVTATTRDRITAQVDLPPRSGWPHHLDLVLDVRLDEELLTLALTATNVGKGPAPWGTTIHPYLAPPGDRDDWTVLVPARQVLEVDARLLPLAVIDVAGTARDLRRPRAVTELDLDHAFTGIPRDAATGGIVRAEVRGRDGHGVHISWEADTCPWIQVFTGDARGIAIEPMTCPPDALNSGTDLVTLAPTDAHTTTWQLGPLRASPASAPVK